MLYRPDNEKELQKREATGVIRASRFVRRYAQSHKKINVETIYQIHKEIFKDAWPEIAGRNRQEELSITGSDLKLPHHAMVPELMNNMDFELGKRISGLKECEGHILNIRYQITEETAKCIEKVLHVVSWLHHKITSIHPFREGNGRTARLAANLILERYGLVGISVKVEKENKNQYRASLSQIDKYEDYEPLEAIITEGLVERYNGVSMKYYSQKSKTQKRN
jgi:fido (protein-threonine AMPylation protein)